MIKLIFINIISFTILLGCVPKKIIAQSTFIDMKKVMFKEEGAEQYFYWEMADENYLWESELGDITFLLKYRDSLKLVLGEIGFEQAVKAEETQGLDNKLIETAEDGDRENALLVHTGTLGKIRKINFLEAQILNYQVKRFALFSHPTEFHGFIAAHEKKKRVRVYFCSSDTEWPPRPNILINHLEEAIPDGWRLKYHLHNHYCKEHKDFIGILAPSLADAQYFKMLSERFELKTALITNGFHTVELDHREFHKFQSH